MAQRGQKRRSFAVEGRGEGEILVVRAFGRREPVDQQIERRREHPDLIEGAHRDRCACGIGIGRGHRRDAMADEGDVVAHVFGEHVRQDPCRADQQRGQDGDRA